MAINWDAIVKTYDVRGLVGTDLTNEIVSALAAGFVDELDAAGQSVIVGHDMRDSSPEFADAFAEGAQARGANVVSIGLCSTDESYFASGSLGAPAAMFTASHNPATYNGIKFSRAGARGISLDTGLANIRDRAIKYLADGIAQVDRPGTYRDLHILSEYSQYLRELVDLSGIRKLKVVVDAGNGMGGMTVPAVLGHASDLEALPLEIVPLYFELDGTFPNHEANPLDPKNLVDLQRAVVEHKADLGLAFDGDADRCFVVDENGDPVTPSAVAAIVARREIARAKANGKQEITVLYNLITSRVVAETIRAEGARAVRTKVGHSLIKDQMAETGAIFGGEHSAHYYFADFWGADNGMLAAMHVLAEFGAQAEPMSKFAAKYNPYFLSGEINSKVTDVADAKARVVAAFDNLGSVEEFDGITISSNETEKDWWWFNVRASNTEPLLRLNVEAATESKMSQLRDEVLALIRA
ncbi:MAG: phosphomannomutase/phosphoglucomutase [Micrococcales bacterium]